MKRMNAGEFFFNSAFMLYCSYNLLRTVMFQKIEFTDTLNYVIYALTISLLLVNCIINNISSISKRMFIFLVLGITASLIVAAKWKKLIPIVLFLFLITVRKIDFNKTLLVIFWILSIFLISTYCFYKLGITRNYVTYDGKMSMGYTYTTTVSHYFLLWVLLFIYLYNHKINYCYIAIILSINYFIFYTTEARSSYYLVILAVAIILLKRVKSLHIEKLFSTKCCAEFSIFICLLITYIMMAFSTGSNTYLAINGLLSGRLSLMNLAFQQHGIPLFGTGIEWSFSKDTGGYNYIDNSFYQICLLYGFVFLLVIVCGFAFMMKQLRIKKYYDLIWILDIILVHSILDPQFIQLTYNPFLLIIGIFMWTPKNSITNKTNLLS